MTNVTIQVTSEEKERVREIKERTRSRTFRDAVSLLVNLYEQLAEGMSRGEEIEFVESIERGEAKEFLRRRLCGRNDGEVREVRTVKEVKGKIKI